MPETNPIEEKRERFKHVIRITVNAVILSGVLALLILCIIYRDKITADEIAKITPANQVAASLMMLLLFGIKSFCIFIYCGILYAASGMIFPLPLAFAVNVCGTVIMTSVPYWFGRKADIHYMDELIEKYPKISFLKAAQEKNSFFLSFIIRIVGILPCDLVSAFFGASTMPYKRYILSTVLGFLPMIGAFTVMGMSVHDVTSPTFIAAAGAEAVIMIGSCVFYAAVRKKNQKANNRTR